ncbi:MAG: hypothetical protein KDD94_11740, partial [Calditrichaeota bacterium]|nr:hypothetical protein [Calditrichota bacterium]
MKYKLEAFNLAALFSSAFALSTFLHEFAHAVMAMSLHVDSVLFHSYVSTKSELVTANQQILISSAGPVFSAVQAVIFFRLFKQRV